MQDVDDEEASGAEDREQERRREKYPPILHTLASSNSRSQAALCKIASSAWEASCTWTQCTQLCQRTWSRCSAFPKRSALSSFRHRFPPEKWPVSTSQGSSANVPTTPSFTPSLNACCSTRCQSVSLRTTNRETKTSCCGWASASSLRPPPRRNIQHATLQYPPKC